MDVYCHSTAKEIKQRDMKSRFEQCFEEKLTDVRKSLHKKHGTKKYEKVLEKIGRLKERYRRVARRYEVRVEKGDTSGNAKDFVWKMKPMDEESGYYVLGSNLNHADVKEVFDIFNMLLSVVPKCVRTPCQPADIVR